VRWQGPELFDEKARKSFASDVYAFGMTMYEVCVVSWANRDRAEYKVRFFPGRFLLLS
jgi:hypothetical protein